MPRPLWIEPEPLPAAHPALHDDPLLNELLYRRAIRDAKAADDFLDARRRPAPDPYVLPAMEAAVARVAWALARGERIAVYGDYDADGVTSTALLVRALRAAASDASLILWRVPTRGEGYGLHPHAIDELAGAGAALLVAVDCASSDHENVAYARSRGLDVVILDHHHMSDNGPDGAVVVSPQLATAGQYRELAAVGVAYLLVAALAQHGCRIDGDGGEPETDLLDYVALGTIGDVAPLTGANRSLVRDGLRRIQERPRPGLAALCRRAGVAPPTLTAEQVVFKLTPRLNAAGRMDDPALAVRLLLTDDLGEAEGLADRLEALNERRRAESRRILAEAEAVIQTRSDWTNRRVLLLTGSGWTSGVLGIAAGQLAERHGRPVVVLSDDGVLSRGSARSVPGFDIAAALDGCRHLLTHHGGHSQAAGLTVPSAQVNDLETALEAALLTADLDLPRAPTLRIDADLPAGSLTLATARTLQAFEPFGVGNEQPLFRLRRLAVRRYNTIGKTGEHLKLHLASGRGSVGAVFWGAAERSRELLFQPNIDAVATIGIDVWDGQPRLQVELKDFRPAQ